MIYGKKKHQKIICTKIKYDKSSAERELNLVRKLHKKYRREVRIYPCPYCKMAWHLTSLEKGEGSINIQIVHQNLWEQILKNQENEEYNDISYNS